MHLTRSFISADSYGRFRQLSPTYFRVEISITSRNMPRDDNHATSHTAGPQMKVLLPGNKNHLTNISHRGSLLIFTPITQRSPASNIFITLAGQAEASNMELASFRQLQRYLTRYSLRSCGQNQNMLGSSREWARPLPSGCGPCTTCCRLEMGRPSGDESWAHLTLGAP